MALCDEIADEDSEELSLKVIRTCKMRPSPAEILELWQGIVDEKPLEWNKEVIARDRYETRQNYLFGHGCENHYPKGSSMLARERRNWEIEIAKDFTKLTGEELKAEIDRIDAKYWPEIPEFGVYEHGRYLR